MKSSGFIFVTCIVLFIFITIFTPGLSSAGTSNILVYLPSYNFDIVNEGSSSAPQTFTIFNMRKANLLIKTIALTGTNASDFIIVNDNCSNQTLCPITICTVDVLFEPTSAGGMNANLSIPTYAPDVPIIEVSLSGIGVQSSYNTVTVLTPNGGEVIPSGSTCSIWWGAPPEAVNFDLWYSMDDGSNWANIANNVGGTSYNWVAPMPRSNLNECFVQVIGYDSYREVVGEDTSDAAYNIEVVKVISPNGGETLKSNSTWRITWKTNGNSTTCGKCTHLPQQGCRSNMAVDSNSSWQSRKLSMDSAFSWNCNNYWQNRSGVKG